MNKHFALPALIIIVAAPILAQNAQLPAALDKQPAAQSAEAAALHEKTVAALKAVGRESGALSVAENRVRYSSEAGDLLWQHDDKAARTLYANALNDFRLVMQVLDAEAQKRESDEAEDTISFFGGGRGGYRSLYQISTLRRNLLLSLAKYDPQRAHDFFRETQRENFKSYGWNDSDLENQIISLLAKNDAARALALGQQKLTKNEFDGFTALTMNLYRQDAEKGARLAAEFVSKFRNFSMPDIETSTLWFAATSLFVQSAENLEKPDTDKQPLLNRGELNALGETIVKTLLEGRRRNSSYSSGQSENLNKYLAKYAPTSYSGLERELKATFAKAKTGSDDLLAELSLSDAEKMAQLEEVEREMRGGEMVGTGRRAGQTIADSEAKGSADKLSKMSPEDIRKNLANIKGRNARFIAAVQIIKTLADKGQIDAAKQLLPEIAEFQVAQPRKASEMMINLFCADALAGIDSARSFVLLENTLSELNGVASTFLRLGEFLEAREIAENNEFNMSGFPREFLRGDIGLGVPQMLVKLAKADADRTFSLADKIERPELRLEAKMLILRSLISSKDAPAN